MNHSLDMIPVLVTGARGQLGDAIRIQVAKANLEKKQLDFTLSE